MLAHTSHEEKKYCQKGICKVINECYNLCYVSDEVFLARLKLDMIICYYFELIFIYPL